MLRSIIVVVLPIAVVNACGGALVNSPKDVGFDNWGTLQEHMLSAMPKVFDGDLGPADFAFETKAMRQIRDRGSLSLWLEMCRLRAYPLVANAGFQCVASKSPKDSFKAALLVIAHHKSDASLLFYLPEMQYLKESVRPTAENFATFSNFVARRDIADKNFPLPITLLPSAFVTQWAKSDDATKARPIVQAYAVSIALRHASDTETQPSDAVTRLYATFVDTEDARRAVWLAHAPHDDDSVPKKAAIAFVLKNEELLGHLYSFALYPHLEFIDKELDLDTLSLTTSQRKKIEALLAPGDR